ncbi:hypothetical protein C5167_014618 [Papaver somniferum]|uniref:Cell wall hydroxyproline-rich glycoprotein n=1 Tax=Papaver somniferum TaxID=3469 RepID=A0A4Y7J5N9_PAPSO|nr:leucine-rich repeat extensin-like protein 6 [Papaver somniferum]RZC55766.1 hypothetical protein C5167_014618 [Papaver somniferum]
MMRNPFPHLYLLAIFTVLFLSKSSHQSLLDDVSIPDLKLGDAFIPNPRLQSAFVALQALKHAIVSDPNKFTSNWYGPDVCSYNGVYCAPAPDAPRIRTVAGIDLNHQNIAGTLPYQLGYLTDLALFHINSNRFYGGIPETFRYMRRLFELDVSNNKFSGKFPSVVFYLSSLKFLDIRFNEFYGDVPSKLFDMKLDALFINDNKFRFTIPKNFANSTVSVLVLANNQLNGCFPSDLGKMAGTLNEIIITNSGLNGCLPPEIGKLNQLTVFDVSFNNLVGPLPETMGNMKSLEQLNIAHNKFSGNIPPSICSLPKLENFTYSYNYFCGEPPSCLKLPDKDDKKNCIPYRPLQRSLMECSSFLSHPVSCNSFGCSLRTPPPPRHY